MRPLPKSHAGNFSFGDGVLMTTTQESLFPSVVDALQRQDLRQAMQTLETLVEEEPNHVEGRRLFGLLLAGSGQREQALHWLLLAARDAPEHPVLGQEAGDLLLALQKPEQATEILRSYLQYHPDNTAAHFSLAMALRQSHRIEDALESYGHVLALDPDSGSAWFNIGNIHHEQGRKEDAAQAWKQALAARNPHGEAIFNLCLIFLELGHTQEAEALHKTIIAQYPDHPLGDRLNAEFAATRGNTPEAVTQLRTYLHKAPDKPEALARLAQLEAAEGDLENARKHARALTGLVGETWLSCTLTGDIETRFGCSSTARKAWKRAAEIRPSDWQAWSNALFLSLHDPEISPEDVFQEHCAFGKYWESRITPFSHAASLAPRRRLRVGYVSPDFCHHAVSLFIEPLFTGHDRSRFEIIGFHIPRRRDETTQRLCLMTDQWHTLPQDPQHAAQLIHAQNIDILVDLAGHTAGNMMPLFAWKPAPLQISMIGYPGTTGLTRIDSRPLYANPPKKTDEQRYSVERLWDKGGTWIIAPPDECLIPSPLPMLERGWPLFGSVNKYLKVDSETRQTWGRILHSCPTARLKVIAAGAEDPETRKILYQSFAADGCPIDRIDLHEEMPLTDWIHFCRGIDVVLDPLNYQGGTTTNLLMAMGIRIVRLWPFHDMNEDCNPSTVPDRDSYVQLACSLVAKPDVLARRRHSDQELDRKTKEQIKTYCLDTIEAEYSDSWERKLSAGISRG